jgi:hypothetical protein
MKHATSTWGQDTPNQVLERKLLPFLEQERAVLSRGPEGDSRADSEAGGGVGEGDSRAHVPAKHAQGARSSFHSST